MTCEDTAGEGCGSCMATLIRSPRRTRQGSDCPGSQAPEAAGDNGRHLSAACETSGSPRLVLMAVMAFVVPIVVSVGVVQSIEGHVGAAAAAIAGLAAAGLTALISASIVKSPLCRSAACGADR